MGWERTEGNISLTEEHQAALASSVLQEEVQEPRIQAVQLSQDSSMCFHGLFPFYSAVRLDSKNLGEE